MKVNIAGQLSCTAHFDLASGKFSLSFDEYYFDSGYVEVVDDDGSCVEGDDSFDKLLKAIEEKVKLPARQALLLTAVETAKAKFERLYIPVPTGLSRDEIAAYTKERHEARKRSLIREVETAGSRWALESLARDYGLDVKITVEIVEPEAQAA